MGWTLALPTKRDTSNIHFRRSYCKMIRRAASITFCLYAYIWLVARCNEASLTSCDFPQKHPKWITALGCASVLLFAWPLPAAPPWPLTVEHSSLPRVGQDKPTSRPLPRNQHLKAMACLGCLSECGIESSPGVRQKLCVEPIQGRALPRNLKRNLARRVCWLWSRRSHRLGEGMMRNSARTELTVSEKGRPGPSLSAPNPIC